MKEKFGELVAVTAGTRAFIEPRIHSRARLINFNLRTVLREFVCSKNGENPPRRESRIYDIEGAKVKTTFFEKFTIYSIPTRMKIKYVYGGNEFERVFRHKLYNYKAPYLD